MTTLYLIRDLVWHKPLYRSPCGQNKKKLGYYVVLGWISQLGWTKVLDFVCTAFFKFSIEAFHCIVCLARAVALIEELIYTFCYYFFFTVSVAGWLCLVLMGSQNDEEEEEKLEKMHLALLMSDLIKEHQYCRGLMEWFWRPQNRIYIHHLSVVMTPLALDVLALWTFTVAVIDLLQRGNVSTWNFYCSIFSSFPYFIG